MAVKLGSLLAKERKWGDHEGSGKQASLGNGKIERKAA